MLFEQRRSLSLSNISETILINVNLCISREIEQLLFGTLRSPRLCRPPSSFRDRSTGEKRWQARGSYPRQF